MPGTIVVPLDQSQLAETALPLALSFVSRIHSRILLVSVIPAPHEFSVWLNSMAVAHQSVLRREDAQRYLDQIADGLSGFEVDTAVRFGNPVVKILESAYQVDSPLLVMASHGHGGVKRLTVGSVAAGIVHSAHCPVIVIRAQEEAPPAPLLSRDPLLVPMDGSPFAEEALSVAREALGSTKLTLHLLRVVETSKWYMNGYESLDYASLETYQAFEEYRDWAREDAAQYLERIAADLATAGHEVSWQVEQGVAVRQIVEVADERNVGMIVMATHGRAGLTRLLLGSVSEQVLHESRRPLMLIRPQQACAEPE